MKLIRTVKWKAWLLTSKVRYHLWRRWRHGDLLSGPVGSLQKVYFPSRERGALSEHMWAKKISRDTYELDNNGFYVHVARGDVVQVKVSWPYLEVIRVLERKQRTVRIFFEPPWPDREARSALAEELNDRGYGFEWGYPYLLTVNGPLDDDPYETIGPLLQENARIFEVD